MSKLIHVNKVKTTKSNNHNIYCTLGASNHTTEMRQDNDYYATDPLAIDALINDGAAVISNPIWECACGEVIYLKDYQNWVILFTVQI